MLRVGGQLARSSGSLATCPHQEDQSSPSTFIHDSPGGKTSLSWRGDTRFPVVYVIVVRPMVIGLLVFTEKKFKGDIMKPALHQRPRQGRSLMTDKVWHSMNKVGETVHSFSFVSKSISDLVGFFVLEPFAVRCQQF